MQVALDGHSIGGTRGPGQAVGTASVADMTDGSDAVAERRLMGAVALFVASTAWGAAVSVREDVLGEPLGWRAPGEVATHLAIGWGSALSAPWPMVAIAFADAVRNDPGRRAGRWCAVVGVAIFAGVLVEPATWGRRARSRLIASTVVANVLAGALLILAARRAGDQPVRS
jgi:hypothetical protein